MADKQTNNLLGKKIKNLRLKNNLSRDRLARKTDVPYTTLTKIEIDIIKKLSFFYKQNNQKIRHFFR